MEYKLENLEENYELELERIISEIKKNDVKSVLLQLPDGLKPWGPTLVDYIEGKFAPKGVPPAQVASADADKVGNVDVRIFLGDCFGACDLPDSDCDLVIQFGHARWE